MRNYKLWTPKEEKDLIKAISRACSPDEALRFAQKACPKHSFTYNSLTMKLKRMGHPPLSDLIESNLPNRPVSEDLTELRNKRLIDALRDSNRKLLDEVALKNEELYQFKKLTREPRPVLGVKRKSDKQRKGAVVLQCSDWHIGETVELDSVNGLNEYNLEIAGKCVDRLADGFEWMLRDPRYDVRTAVIHLGGDLMTGYIHPELQELNSLSPQEEQIWLLDRLEHFLRRLGKENENLDRIIVMCNSGNHGRATDKQRVSSRESNSNEQVVYQTLRRLLKNDSRFEFHIATGEWVEVNVFGFRLAFTHGDSFNYQGGVGGITIPIRRGIDRQFKNQKIHQFCMGHFHSRQDLGDVQINGSMIGYSAYSQRIHAPFEPRQQNWFLIDSERGKCLSAPIWL